VTGSLLLPNSSAGPTSETIGLIEADTVAFMTWLTGALGHGWSYHDVGGGSVSSLLAKLDPRESGPLSKYLLLQLGGWTGVLTDGPLGTDLGVIPSRVARDLMVTAVRATAVDPGSVSFYATVFEVFDHQSSDPQLSRRSIYAADDGGRWRFGQTGDPFPFEELDAYSRRRVRDRFTPEMIRTYLRALGAPEVTLESEVTGFIIDRREQSTRAGRLRGSGE